MNQYMGSEVLAEILTERERQIHVEGWTREHDDQHGQGELAAAAACYAAGEPMFRMEATDLLEEGTGAPVHRFISVWPFEQEWWKPKDRRRDLVRAAALIFAELERLDRAAAAQLVTH